MQQCVAARGTPVTTCGSHCWYSALLPASSLTWDTAWSMAAALRSASTGPAEGGSCGAASGSQCVAAVHAFYAAISRGDGDALAALLAEDVEWDCFEMPTSAQKVCQLRRRRRRRRRRRSKAAQAAAAAPLPTNWDASGLSCTVCFAKWRAMPASTRQADVPWLRAVHGREAVLRNHGIFLALLDGKALASSPGFKPKQARDQSVVDTRGRQRSWCETKPFCCLR